MKVSVIGQGYVGLPLSIAISHQGYKVIGFDNDKNKIENLKHGNVNIEGISPKEIINLSATNRINFTHEKKELLNSDIFIIAVPTPLNAQRKPDLEFLKSASELIGSIIKPEALVINESTSTIGTLRNFIKPIIDKQSGLSSVHYAVAPERIDPGNKIWHIKNTPRVVAGLTEEASLKVFEFYNKLCEKVYLASKPEVAEASKLFENTFRQVNISLVNNLSEVASEFGFSTFETIEAAATKPFGFMPFYPSIGIGGHCIPVDPTYLLYSAKEVGVNFEYVNISNKNNLDRAKVIVDRISNYLNKDFKNIKIQIAGITYKPDINDLRESPAIALMTELRNRGAVVSWSDPVVKLYNGENGELLDTKIDLGLIVTPHSEFNFELWRKNNIPVIDVSSTPQDYGWPKFL